MGGTWVWGALGLLALSLSQMAAAESGKVLQRLRAGTDTLKPLAATHFGGKGIDEFVAAAYDRSGAVVVAGNAWGPDFPTTGDEVVLGQGAWLDLEAFEGGKQAWLDTQAGRRKRTVQPGQRRAGDHDLPLALDNPNRAGFVLRYAADLSRIEQVIRFDWGVATINTMHALPEGDLLIGGRATQAFIDSVVPDAAATHRIVAPDARASVADRFAHVPNKHDRKKFEDLWYADIRSRFGAKYYEGQKLAGHAYVARLKPDGRLAWVTVLEKHRLLAAVQVLQDRWVGVDSQVVYRLDLQSGAPDSGYGDIMQRVDGFDSVRGGSYRFGLGPDGVHRGKADPLGLLAYDDEQGGEAWAAWAYSPALAQHQGLGLASPTRVRAAVVDPHGAYLVALQSREAASIALRHPFNVLLQPERNYALGLKGAFGRDPEAKSKRDAAPPSLTHLVRFQPNDLSNPIHALWCLSATGSLRIDGLSLLADGSPIVRGMAEGALIRTQAHLDSPTIRGSKQHYRRYCTVFTNDLSGLRWSSEIPGVEVTAAVAGPNGGALIVGRSQAAGEGFTPAQAAVTVNGLQAEHGGGYYDGYILVLGR